MERRVLIAICLCFAVLYLWQTLVPPPKPPPPAAATGQRGAESPSTAPAGQTPAAPPAEPAPPAAAPLVSDAAEREVRVETRTVIAVFTNRGGRLKSWRLKHYLDARKEPLELVAPDLPEPHPLPFSLRTSDQAVDAVLNGSLYSIGGDSSTSGPISAPAQLTFEYRDSAGVRSVKEFRVEPDSYVLSFRATVTRNDSPVSAAIDWGPAIGSGGASASSGVQVAEGILYVDGDVERLPAEDLTTQPAREGTFKYGGVDDHYFIAVALEPGPAKFTFQPLTLAPPSGSEDAPRRLVAFAVERPSADTPVRFFVGPKDFDQLALVDRELVRSINFGIFTVIVVPLLRSLKWINGFVGNYGFSIVILTIIINAVMFPLRHKSVVSMRKMQAIQPEAKAIQDRYAKLKATDPAKQKMNQELMALYKERGVNPASGCVPMVLTFPVLFAFYALLTVAIELRGAPFIAWIHDLSLPDPYYVVPLLMGASQFWQQWLQPQAGVDPAQQKMMLMMPAIFTVFSLWFPAGVALYWLVSNVWGIAQMYLTNRLIGPPATRTVRPAAERRMKHVGGSKTDAAAREN